MTESVRWRLWAAAIVVALVSMGAPVLWVWLRPRPARRHVLPRRVTPSLPDPQGIVIHHSDTPGMIHGRPVGAAQISAMHQKRGFGIHYHGRLYHIGYHYVIREDGTIETGRPEHCIGAHSRITEYNHYLGICLIGDFSERANPHHFEPSVPTGQQLRSLVWLCARLAEKYHIPTSRILRHQDIRQTACPGENFPYFWVLWEVDQYRPVLRAQMALAAARARRTATTARRISAYSPATVHEVKVKE